MSKFKYKAVANNGQIMQGVVDAPSYKVAIEKLQHSGHLPISAEEIKGKTQFSLSHLTDLLKRDKVSQHDLVILTSELATLLQAGLPLDNALKTLANLSTSVPLKNLIEGIHERVQGGIALSDALAEHGDVFNRLYINMIRAGEVSGSLELTVSRLADYLERSAALRSSVITALIYPAILLLVLVISLFVLMSFVVPQFIPLFEDVGQALPFMTEVVFALSGFFNQFWWLLVAVCVFAIWFGDKQLSDKTKRLRFDEWCLSLPYLGELLKEIEMARFSRTLGTALGNGVPLLTGIRLVRDVVSNRVIGNVMDKVISSLEQGQGMTRPMKESSVCPVLAVQLIEVGEETGQLESMLNKIANIYDQQVQTSIKRVLTLLEPALIIGMGGLIAFIIASILVAILGLNELVI